MKNFRLSTSVTASTAVALFCICGSDVDPATAQVSYTDTFTVKTAVDQRCTVVANDLDFGTYDYANVNATTPLDATATIDVNCLSGRRADVRLDQGLNPDPSSTDIDPLRQLTNGTDFLPYNLYEDAGYATVWDNEPRGVLTPMTFPATLTIYGRIPPGIAVKTGTYVDTVVATVYF